MHPSPVNSRFKAGGGNAIKQRTLDAMEGFYKFATGPEALPAKFFQHIGRTAVIADLGAVSMSLRMLVHVLGFNFMALMTALTAASTADYQRHVGKTGSVIECLIVLAGGTAAERRDEARSRSGL